MLLESDPTPLRGNKEPRQMKWIAHVQGKLTAASGIDPSSPNSQTSALPNHSEGGATVASRPSEKTNQQNPMKHSAKESLTVTGDRNRMAPSTAAPLRGRQGAQGRMLPSQRRCWRWRQGNTVLPAAWKVGCLGSAPTPTPERRERRGCRRDGGALTETGAEE